MSPVSNGFEEEEESTDESRASSGGTMTVTTEKLEFK
jgi:hypothetical protein